MRGEPSAKANQSPTHGFNDRPAAQVSNLVQNINFGVLGLDNGVWFSLPNPINFLSFYRLNQKEIHEYLRPSSQDQYDFSDGFHTVLTFRLCFKLTWGDLTPSHQREDCKRFIWKTKMNQLKNVWSFCERELRNTASPVLPGCRFFFSLAEEYFNLHCKRWRTSREGKIF